MKKLILFLGLTMLLLVGCQSKPSIALDDVIDETYNNRDDVKNYYIDSNAKFYMRNAIFDDVDAGDAQDMIDANNSMEQTAVFRGDMDEENNEADVEAAEITDAGEVKQHVIFKDNYQYANTDGQWQKHELGDFDLRDNDFSYYQMVDRLRELNEFATIEHDNNEYVATYKGPANKVFHIFEDTFSLSLTGFDMEDEVTMSITAKISDDTFHLTELNILIEAASELGEIDMDLTTTFENINEITIELPQEAIDATE